MKVALYKGTKHHVGEIGGYSGMNTIKGYYALHTQSLLVQPLPRSAIMNFSTPNLVTVNCKVVTYTIKSNTTLRYLSQPC